MAIRIIQPAAEIKRGNVEVVAAAAKPTVGEEVMGAVTTFNRAIPGMDEVADALQAGSDLVTGRAKGPLDAWRGARARSKGASDAFAARHPVGSEVAKGFGLAAQVAPALFTGGATVAPQLTTSAAPAARGLLASSARAAGRIAAPAAKSATVAGLGAQATGLAGEGSLRERVEDANAVTVPAMMVGAALPVALSAAGAARRGSARALAGTGKATARIANRATGGKLLDPKQEAAKRLGEALKADGLGPQEVRLALEQWQRTGASSPALLNLAGENTKALLRAAAAKPSATNAARNAAVAHVNQVEADLQGNAIARTRALTPTQRQTAARMAQELEARQGAIADELYPGPYAIPVPVGDDVMAALSDEPGAAALRRARAAAVARRNDPQVAEIDALLARRGSAAEEAVEPLEVSGGTLDRIRIAMAGRGAKAQQSPDTRDIAGGLFSRAADIDAALDEVPGLAPARSTYRGMQAQRDALDLGGENAFANPDEYVDELARLADRATPDDNPYPVTERDIVDAAQVGLRSDLERQIGAPAENATGLLNRVATGTNPRRVLEETYGLEDASLYRDAMQREIDKVADARFISPNSGSKTANVLLDQLIEAPTIPTSPLGVLRVAIDKVRRGVSLTDAERAALMELGTRRIEAPGALPDIPEARVPQRLLTPAQRQRIAQAMAQAEGSARAQPEPVY